MTNIWTFFLKHPFRVVNSDQIRIWMVVVNIMDLFFVKEDWHPYQGSCRAQEKMIQSSISFHLMKLNKHIMSLGLISGRDS